MDPVARPGAPLNVDQLAAQVEKLASSQHLAVVPVTPLVSHSPGHQVIMDSNDLSAADFCRLAATAGAKLLYVQARGFDASTDPDLELGRQDHSEPDQANEVQVAELCRDAERYNGRVPQLELVFVAECVLHCWTVTADWYDSLVGRAAWLLSEQDLEA